MEFRFGNLLFTSKFDSANLAQVEKTRKEEDDTTGNFTVPGLDVIRPDYEYNVWTKPDCGGTEHENGNRSWFYFGIRGWIPNKVIKINIMNLNRQGKLYSQGHSPFTRTLPGKPKWERIRDRPSYEVVEGQFILSFTYRFPETKGATTYFAFCFPWSYTECQNQMNELDTKFNHCKNFNSNTAPDSLYYHRELLCLSLDKLRVDLITISSCHGMMGESEQCFDKHLFPDRDKPRCKKFKGKKVYFLSSRVHPGETPASFVYNGFLEFLLRENDPRAQQLRRQYVFKLIPLLNPDGVMRGHYRTDSRGVNLNRVYLDPSPVLHPSIYAAKSLLVYHHVYNRTVREGNTHNISVVFPTNEVSSNQSPQSSSRTLKAKSVCSSHGSQISIPEEIANAVIILSPHCSSQTKTKDTNLPNNTNHSNIITSSYQIIERLNLADLDCTDSSVSDSGLPPDTLNNKSTSRVSSSCTSVLSYLDATKGNGRKVNSELRLRLSELTMSEDYRGDSVCTDKLSDSDGNCNNENIGNEGSEDEDSVPSSNNAAHLCNPQLLSISPSDSGVAFYVDLHGHASKRGAFIYGNYLENEDMQVENMLFPKLISLNTAHFDFTGCNFSERNMYTKDKRDGMSKEGSGRVSTLKAIGIIHSYTLECNYNTGRMVNPVPPAQNDDGRATPPPLAGFPPKYTQAHYEEIGRALAIAALDMIKSNPWSRVGSSENSSLQGVRESVRRYLRSIRGGPSGGKNGFNRQTSRNGSVGSINQNNNRQVKGKITEIISNNKSSRRLSTDISSAPVRRLSTDGTNYTQNRNPGVKASVQSATRKELAPVKESIRGNQSRRQMNLPTCGAKTASTSSAPVALIMTRTQQNQTFNQCASADITLHKDTENDDHKINSLLTLANKKQGPATKLPLPTGTSPLHLLAPANIDVNSSSKPSSYTIQKNRNGSGSRWALEDAMFHNDCNLMTTRSGAPSSGHSGKRFIQFSANSLHRVPISSALSSSSSSTMRVNSGHHSGVSPVISAQSTTDDFIQSGETPKQHKRPSHLKRKPGIQSPKFGVRVNGIYNNLRNEIDRKPRHRRRKSQRRLSFLSPTDDEIIQDTSPVPSTHQAPVNSTIKFHLKPR